MSSLRIRARGMPYGWLVVAALCVTETVTWGIVYYGFPVFLRPMEQELGADLEQKLATDWANVEVLAAHKSSRDALQALLTRWEQLFEQAST